MSTPLGTIGETVTKLYYLRHGYEVYVGDDGTYHDMIVQHSETHEVLKIEVKTTRRRNNNKDGWKVDIRRSYGDLPFDKNRVDILAVYIEPIDKLLLFDAKKVKQTTGITFKDTYVDTYVNDGELPQAALGTVLKTVGASDGLEIDTASSLPIKKYQSSVLVGMPLGDFKWDDLYISTPYSNPRSSGGEVEVTKKELPPVVTTPWKTFRGKLFTLAY